MPLNHIIWQENVKYLLFPINFNEIQTKNQVCQQRIELGVEFLISNCRKKCKYFWKLFHLRSEQVLSASRIESWLDDYSKAYFVALNLPWFTLLYFIFDPDNAKIFLFNLTSCFDSIQLSNIFCDYPFVLSSLSFNKCVFKNLSRFLQRCLLRSTWFPFCQSSCST